MAETKLEPYRRHSEKCKYRDKGQNYTKCGCVIWAYGELNGRPYRRSLGTRDWQRAAKKVAKIEAKPQEAIEPRSLAGAMELYLSDCRARKLKESTIISYGKTLDHLKAFMESLGLRSVEDIDLEVLTAFRAGRMVKATEADEPSRPIAATTSGKELETLRAFCAFAVVHGWIEQNFARQLKAPKEDGPPTMPFTREEVDSILQACDRLEDDNPHTVERTRIRARAICLTLLYSGMRISDVMKLERKAVDLDTGKLFLRTMKTGVPLYVRLGDVALEALAALPAESDRYFLWNGTAKLSTCVGNARRAIDRVCALAGIIGHPHRFRDTFSVRLLDLGNELHTVQLLLGHTSIKTTEKHYAPFVESRQAQLDAATAGLDFGTEICTDSRTARKTNSKLLRFKQIAGGS